MTLSTDPDTQAPSAATPPRSGDAPLRLMRWVMAHTILAGAGAVGCLAISLITGDWHAALAGATLLILSTQGGAVLMINAMVCDRQEFYRRGQLDGWYRGYRMQVPEVDDPLFR